MTEPEPPTLETVEAVVRHQLSVALGGRRGMIEAAAPTLIFTFVWLATKDLRVSLVPSLAVAVVLLVVRLVQRSSVQFVMNALFGIALAWVFVRFRRKRGRL